WQNGWDKTNVPSIDHHERGLALGKDGHKPSKKEVEGILYSFSATLATASSNLSPKTRDDVLKADPLAVSWLLSRHDVTFDPVFLVRAFDVCVKDVIVYEASQKGQGIPGMGEVRGAPPLRLTGWDLYKDPRVATLNAISRNPAAALQLERGFQPFDLRYGGGHGTERVKSMADLLYKGANLGHGYPDSGNCVG